MWYRSLIVCSLLVCTAAAAVRAQADGTSSPKKNKPAAAEPDTGVPEIDLIEGKVLMVTDGDQLRVKTADGKVFSVRIHGVDAPEQDQEHGYTSRKELEAILLDKEVMVAVHRRDSQGRYMGTVFLNGQDIGPRLLENGIAWHYKRVSGEQSFTVRARYAAAELKAREAKTGLWSDPMPVPPWEFREEVEEAGSEAAVAATPAKAVTEEAKKEPAATQAARPAAPKPGRVYILGPRGGCYYLNDSGTKVYVKDKSVCPKP